VSTDDRIAMLEALLARVKSRTRDRTLLTNGTTPHADDDVAAGLPASPRDVPTPMAPVRPSPLPPPPLSTGGASQPPSAPRFSQRPEAPPLSFSAKPLAFESSEASSFERTLQEVGTQIRRAAPPAEPSRVRAVEPPPMEVVELDVDPDPSIPPPSIPPPASVPPISANGEDPFESRSRLVSAPPAPFEMTGLTQLDDVFEDEPFELSSPASDPTIEAAPAEVSQAELDAIEEADRAPSSSRRPISMEDKMSELEDSIPLHTPPPESGKLPAASPAIELHLDAQPASAPVPVAAPALAREALRGDPLSQTEIAVFLGRTPSDVPAKTFGDLLETTLSL